MTIEHKFCDSLALNSLIIDTLGTNAEIAVKQYNEEKANNHMNADRNLQTTGESFLSRIDTTGFFFYQLGLADGKGSNKFEPLDEMGFETSRKVPLVADKIPKPRIRNQAQTYSSDNLNVNVGVLFRGKQYDNFTILNTQALVKKMLHEGQFENNDFLIGLILLIVYNMSTY